MYKDKIDEKIIGYLKEDSRGSFVDIGKKLKLSESAVRRRVKNLVDGGTIKKFTLEMGEEKCNKCNCFSVSRFNNRYLKSIIKAGKIRWSKNSI